MKVRISEVWNYNSRFQELAVIETPSEPRLARMMVHEWITQNRPDLNLATGINDHGFHAVEVVESGRTH